MDFHVAEFVRIRSRSGFSRIPLHVTWNAMDQDGCPVIAINELKPRTMSWLWPNRLAVGKLSMFDGDPGRGKSLVTLDLCARVTTGRPMPDGTGGGESANVLIVQGEDLADDTMLPRLRALG